MPSLTVYTEETFYYEDNIRVLAKQNFMDGNTTNITFFMDDQVWFQYEIHDSIYTMQGIKALLVCRMKEHGHTPDFKYSRKWISYNCSEKSIVDTVDFYITETDHPGTIAVVEQVNHSNHLKSRNIGMHFYDFPAIRQFTDSVFYGSYVQPA
jgi:hypothetical protein